MIQRARDELALPNNWLKILGGKNERIADLESKVRDLQSQLAAQAAVVEAARTWAKWHGDTRDPVVPMSRPVRELHEAIRALPIVEPDADVPK